MSKRTVTFAGTTMTLDGNEIKVGDRAPNFEVLKDDLSSLELAHFKGKRVVISVVPSVDTSVCAAQTRRFNEEASSLKDTEILTISCDLPFALGRFCANEGLDHVTAASDHKDLDFGLKYGFVIKDLRLLARGIVIIDQEGVITYIERVPEVTDEVDFDKALKILR